MECKFYLSSLIFWMDSGRHEWRMPSALLWDPGLSLEVTTCWWKSSLILSKVSTCLLISDPENCNQALKTMLGSPQLCNTASEALICSLSTPKMFSDDQMGCTNPGKGEHWYSRVLIIQCISPQGHILWDRVGEYRMQTEQIYFVNEIITGGWRWYNSPSSILVILSVKQISVINNTAVTGLLVGHILCLHPKQVQNYQNHKKQWIWIPVHDVSDHQITKYREKSGYFTVSGAWLLLNLNSFLN